MCSTSHVSCREHGMGLPATGVHVPVYQITTHEFIGRAKLYCWVPQAHDGEMFPVKLEVDVRE